MSEILKDSLKNKVVNVHIIEDSKLDSELIQDLIKVELRKCGLTPKVSATSKETSSYNALNQNHYDIVVFDIDLDRRMAGLDLLGMFTKKVQFPIISSCRESDDIVKKAYSLGCEHFLNKPIKQSKIAHLVDQYTKQINSKSLLRVIKSRYMTQDEETLSELNKVTSSKNSHLFGPTGVGKQIVAELIHHIHYGNSSPFVEKNCSSITESLAESFLFGHEKGAFTGANNQRKGIFELAKGGTVFLDEIDKTSKSFQAKLLKVIEKKEIQRVGSEKSIPVDFSLVTASSTDLNLLVENDKFLPDLWERLQVEVIHLKPLRERPLDIELQMQNFIRIHESGRLFVISEEAHKFLMSYHWPGNTRELKNVVDSLQRKNIKILELKDLKFLQKKSIRQQYGLVNQPILQAMEQNGLKNVINQICREAVHHFFTQNDGKRRITMRQLEISSDTLYRHLKENTG